MWAVILSVTDSTFIFFSTPAAAASQDSLSAFCWKTIEDTFWSLEVHPVGIVYLNSIVFINLINCLSTRYETQPFFLIPDLHFIFRFTCEIYCN